MHYTTLALKQNKKNKRKSRIISIILHLVLFLALLFPFLNESMDRDKNYAITINFDRPISVKSSKSKGAKSTASQAADEKNEAKRPKIQETKQLQKTEVKTVDFKKTPPLINAPMPSPIKVPDYQKPDETDPEPIEEIMEIDDSEMELEEIPEPEIIEEEIIDEPEVNIDDIISEIMEEEAAELAEAAQKATEAGGTGSGTGNRNSGDGLGKKDLGGEGAGEGNANSGDGKTDSGEGAGLEGEGFEGDGILSRQPVETCDFLQLSVIEGKVVFDICINRQGVPTKIKYDRANSSIRNIEFVRDLQLCFEDYRFEEDYDAPKNECGKFNFKFSFESKTVTKSSVRKRN